MTTDEEIAEKVKELWNWIASNMTTGDISSIRRSQAFLPVFKKEMVQYFRSFASTIAEAVRGEERERIIQKLQANIWEVSSGFDIESKMHNGIIDHLIKEVRKI